MAFLFFGVWTLRGDYLATRAKGQGPVHPRSSPSPRRFARRTRRQDMLATVTLATDHGLGGCSGRPRPSRSAPYGKTPTRKRHQTQRRLPVPALRRLDASWIPPFPQASLVLVTLGAVALTALIGGLWTLLQRALARHRTPRTDRAHDRAVTTATDITTAVLRRPATLPPSLRSPPTFPPSLRRPPQKLGGVAAVVHRQAPPERARQHWQPEWPRNIRAPSSCTWTTSSRAGTAWPMRPNRSLRRSSTRCGAAPRRPSAATTGIACNSRRQLTSATRPVTWASPPAIRPTPTP